MVRAANTGVSAMIDPQGRVTSSIGLNLAGFIDAALPAPGAPTAYARTGDLPWALLLLFVFFTMVLRRLLTGRAIGIDADQSGA